MGKPETSFSAGAIWRIVRGKWIVFVPYIIFLSLFVFTTILQPKSFNLNWIGIKTDAVLTLILVTMGQTLVLIMGGIDLSVGGIICLTNSVAALYMNNSTGSILTMSIAVLAIGAFIGAINGLIIVKTRLQPFIVTLVSWSVWGGVAFWVLPTDGGTPPAKFIDFLLGRIIGIIPVSLIIIILAILFWLYLKNTSFGVSIFAVGSNEKAVYLNGINVDRVKIVVYSLSGLFAATAGLYRTAQVASGSPVAGNDYIMTSLAAAVIGGTSLSGGNGGIMGSIVGAFILKMINDILIFAGVSSYWSALFQGCLLIVAVAIGSIAAMREGGEVYL
ncbi:MAG TPA: ABC transporter permease [Firmicutes bacterium]|nr:ABC transporter permease [Bacillota bacterium]